MNDLDQLKRVARRYELALALDCVSAIGAVPVDLSGVYLASGASGKALAALPGLSFVFHSHDVAPAPTRLPRYLDLGYYADKEGIPFTHSSNLVAALDAALSRFNTDEPFERVASLSSWLRPRLRELGLPLLVDDGQATPAVVTIPLPPSLERDGPRRSAATPRPPRGVSERVPGAAQLVPDRPDGPLLGSPSRASGHRLGKILTPRKQARVQQLRAQNFRDRLRPQLSRSAGGPHDTEATGGHCSTRGAPGRGSRRR